MYNIALVLNNVVKELKDIDWDTLRYGILQLPKPEVERIERMYVSQAERKSAGVLFWVDHHPKASWRLPILQLDEKRNIH